MIYQTLLVS